MKKGNWIPLDKNLSYFLPKERPFTELEAMFSYTLDINNKRTVSISGYSKLWDWNRKKVRKLFDIIGTEKGQAEGQKRDTTINSNLLNTNPNINSKENIVFFDQEKYFEILWKKRPNGMTGKKGAFSHFKTSVKDLEVFKRVNVAWSNYLGSRRVKGGFIQNGKTWFNNWEDWEDLQEPLNQKDPYRKISQSEIDYEGSIK